MKIKNIRAVNFKGRNFDQAIDPVTIICGDNFSGKTAFLDAVRIGLMGYLPRLGKQPSSTFKLAGAQGEIMGVTLLTDQTEINLAWTHGKKTVSFDGQIPWETPPVLLDTHEYFNQTTAERLNVVFRLCDPNTLGYSDEKLLAGIDAIEILPTKVSRPIITQKLAELKTDISQRNGKPVQVWLESVVSKLKDAAKYAAQLNRNLSTVCGSLKPVLGAARPVDVSAQLKNAEACKNELNGRIEAIRQQISSQKAAQERSEQIRLTLDTLPIIDAAELNLMKVELESVPDVNGPRHVLLNLQRASSELLKQINTIQKNIQSKENEPVLSRCPMCFADQPGWDATITKRRDLEIKSMREELEKLFKRQGDIQIQIKDAEIEFERVSAIESRVKSAMDEINEKQKSLNNRKLLEAELSGITLSAVDASNLSSLEIERDKFAAEVNDLRNKQAEYDAWTREQSKRNDVESNSIKALIESEVLKSIVKFIQSMQSEMVEVAFNDLLIKSRYFTDGIMLSPLLYYEGEIGRVVDGKFVSWETFSGLETALTFAGLSVALAQQAPIKVVMIDELGTFTPENKEKVLRRMIELTQAGIIDNFIGADVSETKIDGVKTIKL